MEAFLIEANDALNSGKCEDALHVLDDHKNQVAGGGIAVHSMAGNIRAACYLRLGKIKDALQVLEGILAEDPTDSIATTNLNAAKYADKLAQVEAADSNFRQGNLDQAKAGYESLLQVLPDEREEFRAHIYSNYGSLLLQMREDVMAVTMLDKALELNPKSVDLSLAKAAALKHLGLNDEALACLDQAIVQNPSASNLLMSKVELLCGPDMERYEEGVQLADQVIALEPKNRAYYLKGFGLLRLNRWEDAEASLQRAKDRGDNGTETTRLLAVALSMGGHALSEQGKFEEAFAKYEKAISLGNPSKECLYNYSVTLIKGGRRDRAKQILQRLIDIQPNHFGAQATLGLVHLQDKECDEAIEHLENARTADINNDSNGSGRHKEVLQNVAIAYIHRGRQELAAARLKELLQLDPENSIARKALDDLEHDLAISAFQAMKVNKEKDQDTVTVAPSATTTSTTAASASVSEEGGQQEGTPVVTEVVTTTKVSICTPNLDKLKAGAPAVPVDEVKPKATAPSVVSQEPVRVSSPSSSTREYESSRFRLPPPPMVNIKPAEAPAPEPPASANDSEHIPADPNGEYPEMPYESLKAPGPYPSKIWLEHRELYLSDAAFVAQFNMNKAQFKALPQWRQNKLKKEAGLF